MDGWPRRCFGVLPSLESDLGKALRACPGKSKSKVKVTSLVFLVFVR